MKVLAGGGCAILATVGHLASSYGRRRRPGDKLVQLNQRMSLPASTDEATKDNVHHQVVQWYHVVEGGPVDEAHGDHIGRPATADGNGRWIQPG